MGEIKVTKVLSIVRLDEHGRQVETVYEAEHASRGPWPEFDDRPRCINHHQPEPCGICRSYIAAGL